MNEETLREILEDFVRQLTELLEQLPQEVEQPLEMKLPVFFDAVRPVFGSLRQSQVAGMEAKLKAFKAAGWPVAWAAYGLATSFHETAKKMQPVREGLNASDAWRKKNLRYYPWYGRGDVQLTWERNYKKADDKLDLGGRLLANPDLALDPEVSARVLVEGMTEGWFTGKKLSDYLPKDKLGTATRFKQARKIINGTDKDDLIAGYALKFQTALALAGY